MVLTLGSTFRFVLRKKSSHSEYFRPIRPDPIITKGEFLPFSLMSFQIAPWMLQRGVRPLKRCAKRFRCAYSSISLLPIGFFASCIAAIATSRMRNRLGLSGFMLTGGIVAEVDTMLNQPLIFEEGWS